LNQNSLLALENSLFLLIREFVSKRKQLREKFQSLTGMVGNFAKFPVIFPVSRELATETGPIRTASPANQSDLRACPVCIARIRAIAEFFDAA
jgi:hypothetical protein